MSPHEAALLRSLRDAFYETDVEIHSAENRSIAGKPANWLAVQLAVEKLSNVTDTCRRAFEEEGT